MAPPLWDGGFPLDHYELTLRRWAASQQRWERVQLDGHAAQIEVPATTAAAAATTTATTATHTRTHTRRHTHTHTHAHTLSLAVA